MKDNEKTLDESSYELAYLRVLVADLENKNRQTEELLRVVTEQYRRITEGVSDYIFSVHIVDGNPLETVHGRGCLAITGYSPEEFASNNFLWINMVFEDDRALVLKHVAGILSGKDTAPFEHRIVRKDGAVRWVRNIPVCQYDPQGTLIAYDGLIQDVTERRQAEQALLKSELEVMGIIAGGIAHDFNKLTAAILENISQARSMAPPDSKLYDLLRNAEDASLRSHDLTQQLSIFSKRGTPVKEHLLIGDLITKTSLDALRDSCIDTDLVIPEDLRPVYADERQMALAIRNIVLNAKETMGGKGLCAITAVNATVRGKDSLDIKPGDYVRVSIKDDGPGIADENISKIFSPFFTTKETEAQKGSTGAGLGLAIAYSIIANHDGVITVESEAGKGTTFHIYLPAAQ